LNYWTQHPVFDRSSLAQCEVPRQATSAVLGAQNREPEPEAIEPKAQT
jgi:hypothetical protein